MKIDTSDEACERACQEIITHWVDMNAGFLALKAVDLIRALCAERDEANKERAEYLDKNSDLHAGIDRFRSHAESIGIERDCLKVRAEHAESELSSLRAEQNELNSRVDLLRGALDLAASDASSLRAKGCDWNCNANPRAGEPTDCDWPNCGCDPHVERVIAGLREGDWEILTPKEAHERAKGCGVSAEQRKALRALRENTAATRALDYSGGQGRTVSGHAVDAIDALLQSAPQDAKPPAPMEGEVAELIERGQRLARMSTHEMLRPHAEFCREAANALESLSRRNEGDGWQASSEQIKHMVNRFLGWTLPENFNPDAGISFKRTPNPHHAPGAPAVYPMPSGTNLFDATQADAMVRYMVDGVFPSPPEPSDAAVEAAVRTLWDSNRRLVGASKAYPSWEAQSPEFQSEMRRQAKVALTAAYAVDRRAR